MTSIDVVQETADFFNESRDATWYKLANSCQNLIDAFKKFNWYDQMTEFEEWYRRTQLWYMLSKEQIYEQVYCRYFLTPRQKIDNFAGYYKGRVLDFGCGIGRVGLRALNMKSCKSVDFLDVGLTSAFVAYLLNRRKLDGVGRNVSVPSGLYDVITMSNVLEHLSEPVDVCKYLKQFLKPGGIVVGSAPFKTERGEGYPTHLRKHYVEFKTVLMRAGYKEDQIKDIDFVSTIKCEDGEY